MCRSQTILKPKLQPLHVGAIGHEGSKRCRVGVWHMHDIRILEVLGRLGILANAPASGVLELSAQQEGMEEFGTLWMRCVLEDGTSLGPADELAVCGESHADTLGRFDAHGAGECRGEVVVGLLDEGKGGG